MKALVGAFNQEKALVGAFSVIVKTGCGTDGPLHVHSSTSPSRGGGCTLLPRVVMCNVEWIMFQWPDYKCGFDTN